MLSNRQLWKNLWIAGEEKSQQMLERRFSKDNATNHPLANCMRIMYLARKAAHFWFPSVLPVGNYSYFKGFHRSVLPPRYNFTFLTIA
jgi:hypothetical protein